MTRDAHVPCKMPKIQFPSIRDANAFAATRFTRNNLDPILNLNMSLTSNLTLLWGDKPYTPSTLTPAMAFYCYATPLLIVLGMMGNILSVKVFLSRSMRKLEASVYLSALSFSDMAALLCYVLVDWLRRGAGHIGSNSVLTLSVFENQGLCEVQMYLSYVTRFLSAWIIVVFTVERYLATCHPLRRRRWFVYRSRSSFEILLALLVTSLILMIYKPVLTGRYEHRVRNRIIGKCSRNPSYPILSFVLDSVFAMSITFIPFLIITCLNILIVIRLYRRHKRIRTHIVTEESVVRMEFTIIFLVISFVFIALNLPFFCLWCNRFLKSFYNKQAFSANWAGEADSAYSMTRVIFYMSYSINFFLYSVSGACFRKQLRMMLLFKRRECSRSGHMSMQCQRDGNASSIIVNQRSWV